jgi:hypothetical protein
VSLNCFWARSCAGVSESEAWADGVPYALPASPNTHLWFIISLKRSKWALCALGKLGITLQREVNSGCPDTAGAQRLIRGFTKSATEVAHSPARGFWSVGASFHALFRGRV